MVTSMQPLLPSPIDNFQNAFVPGRHMDDNILISHELTHFINKQHRGNKFLAALKIDMNKAYNRVNWLFLLKVLAAYGFPTHWIHLVRQCISTVTYKVLINGEATNAFQPTCGLRQGDPLSPYLFLFCMDILSRMTTLAIDIGQFKGIQVNRRALAISYLFFADDSMFFFHASATSCQAVSTVITRFCTISGQMLNRQKSFVKFSKNIPENQHQDYKGILQVATVNSLSAYLGTPIDIQGSKVGHFTPLLDKISMKITQWNQSTISQSAKIIIINSILLGTITHQLCVFKIPTTVVNKIESLMTVFLWRNHQGKGIQWKNKTLVQAPKNYGGLGICNVGVFNNALLMKKAWRIKHNPHLLLACLYNNWWSAERRRPINPCRISWGVKELWRQIKS